jgi:hypothetical protein
MKKELFNMPKNPRIRSDSPIRGFFGAFFSAGME